MSHPTGRPHISRNLQKTIWSIPSVEQNGVTIIKDFGVFIDTHRDQPHVGTFTEDIHRGACRPLVVDYLIEDDALKDQVSGRLLERHDKHLFITQEVWGEFLVNWMMQTGEDPRGGDGTMVTTHLRNSRTGVNFLRSFRQMVAYNAAKAVK